jgi:hypothetical protein
MALGEQLAESSGKITGTGVVPPVGEEQVHVEVSFQGNGTILGAEMSEVGTYWQSARAGGVPYGEGDILWITNEGESVCLLEGIWGWPNLQGASPQVISL